MKLREVLDLYVRVPEGCAPMEALVRAETGGRVVGAISLAAAVANGVPANFAREMQEALLRPSGGLWGYFARRCLAILPRGHPLDSWREWQATATRRRGIDCWLDELETNLRHHGRILPGDEGLRLIDAVRREVEDLCGAIANCVDVEFLGSRGHTNVRINECSFEIAPFLEIDGTELLLWERATSRGCTWRRGAGKVGAWLPHAEPKAPWAERGAARLLVQQAGGNPVAPFLGAETQPALAWPVPGRCSVWLVDGDDLQGQASQIATQLRSVDRAVVCVDADGAQVLEALADVVGCDSHRVLAQLKQWGRDGPRLMVLIVGHELAAASLLELSDSAGQQLWVAGITLRHTVEHVWQPEFRHKVDAIPSTVPTIGAPAPVLTRLARGDEVHVAWCNALAEAFALRDSQALGELSAVLAGTIDLVDSDRGLAWWRQGRVWVAADGGIHPYPAWQTALDGVLNRHYEEQPVGAWRGGLRLRQLLVEGPK